MKWKIITCPLNYKSIKNNYDLCLIKKHFKEQNSNLQNDAIVWCDFVKSYLRTNESKVFSNPITTIESRLFELWKLFRFEFSDIQTIEA